MPESAKYQNAESENGQPEKLKSQRTNFDAVEWIFFDMGSTLLDESVASAQWFSTLSKLTEVDAVSGSSKSSGSGKTPQQVESEYFERMTRYEASSVQLQHSLGIAQNDIGSLYPAQLDRLFPDTKNVVEQLSKKYRLGIIANQNAGSQSRLDALGIGKFFDVVVSSAEAGCKKPDLRIFRMALAQAGSRYEHEPWRTVMVGDRLDNDIYPANQLGMKTIRIMQGYAVGQKPRSCEWEPDATVARLTELLSIF